jgi:hypothetical protein
MIKQLLTDDNFDQLRRYRTLLYTLRSHSDEVKKKLKLTNDQDFLRVYQPSLDITLMQVDGQLLNWPAIFDWYNGPFYELTDLNHDILLFGADLKQAFQALSREQRNGYLSTLDLDRPPFQLNGRFKKLRVQPALAFTLDLKQKIYNRQYEVSNGAFAMQDLLDRTYRIIPHYVKFIEGALAHYAELERLDSVKGNSLIIKTRAEMAQLNDQGIAMVSVATDLGEGYSRLSGYLLSAFKPLVDVYPSLNIMGFKEKIDSLTPNIIEANAMLSVK